ncbi:MAG: hypothetical protein ACK5NE_01570, partial [Brachymonas sp.]
FDGIQIAGAQKPLLVSQIKNALGVGVGKHGSEYVPFIRLMQCLDEIKEPPSTHSIPPLGIEPASAKEGKRGSKAPKGGDQRRITARRCSLEPIASLIGRVASPQHHQIEGLG